MLFADDDDVHVVVRVTDTYGGMLDFSPTVLVGDATKTGTWLTDEGYERDLRIPLDGLSPGTYSMRLSITGDNDLDMGTVTLS
jgi:hypothetical protein